LAQGKKRRAGSRATLGIDPDSEEFLQDLRGMLWNSVPTCGMEWPELAREAKLHVSTIENFLFGQTKRPQMNTIYRLLTAMGFRIGILAADSAKQPGEIALHRFHNTKQVRGKGRRKPLGAYAAR
jgi:DNA-binding phage protein